MLMNCASDLDVLIDAPEILVLRFADGAAEAGADGIDEDQVGFVEAANWRCLRVGRGRAAVAAASAVTTRRGPNAPMCSQMEAEPGPPL